MTKFHNYLLKNTAICHKAVQCNEGPFIYDNMVMEVKLLWVNCG